MKIDFKLNALRDLLDSKKVDKKGLKISPDSSGSLSLDNGSGYISAYAHISLTIEQCEVLRDYLNKHLEV